MTDFQDIVPDGVGFLPPANPDDYEDADPADLPDVEPTTPEPMTHVMGLTGSGAPVLHASWIAGEEST